MDLTWSVLLFLALSFASALALALVGLGIAALVETALQGAVMSCKGSLGL